MFRGQRTFLPMLVLAACLAGCFSPVTPSPTLIPEQHIPAVTPTEERVATELPTVEPETCTDSGGTLLHASLPSQLLGTDLEYSIYLPPCYDANSPAGYPVLYLLHGQSAINDFWLDLGVDALADGIITRSESQPFLIVMPVEKNFLADIGDTQYPQAIAEELVLHIDQNYDTCTDRECRAIGGISRGAAWAVNITFSYPALFAYIGVHSPAVFSADLARLPVLLKNDPHGLRPVIYLDSGDQDAYLKSAKDLEAILMQYGVPHEWHQNIGAHNFEYWLDHAAEYMQWYASHWPTEK
jgi:enterochelin esterase-like enzyme